MERALIEKYLAGENSSRETQQLRQLLESKPSVERSAEEQALLLMLTGIRQEPDDDLFGADYSDEYEKVVRRNTRRKLWKTAAATIAIAACVVAVWFLGHGESGVRTNELEVNGGKSGTGSQENNPVIKESLQSDSDFTTAVPNPELPVGEHVKPEVNHYAWAKALMESYKEEDLGEITETTDNMLRQEKDWAQK